MRHLPLSMLFARHLEHTIDRAAFDTIREHLPKALELSRSEGGCTEYAWLWRTMDPSWEPADPAHGILCIEGNNSFYKDHQNRAGHKEYSRIRSHIGVSRRDFRAERIIQPTSERISRLESGERLRLHYILEGSEGVEERGMAMRCSAQKMHKEESGLYLPAFQSETAGMEAEFCIVLAASRHDLTQWLEAANLISGLALTRAYSVRPVT